MFTGLSAASFLVFTLLYTPCVAAIAAVKREMGSGLKAGIVVAVCALWLDSAWKFWLMATMVGVFQGAIQALSRSYFAKIIPKEKSSEYFGIFDIFGKGASFMGTMLMGITTQIFGTSRAGVVVIAAMFVVGFICFRVQCRVDEKEEAAPGGGVDLAKERF